MLIAITRFMTLAPYCVTSTDNLARAHRLMLRHAIRHLPVVDDGELAGVVDERDLAALEGDSELMRTTPVARVLRTALSVASNTSVVAVVDLMVEHHVDFAVVRRPGGNVVGIFTLASDAPESRIPGRISA